MKKQKLCVIAIDAYLHQKLKKMASVKGLKLGWIANDALHKYLMKHDSDT
jgi:hypothetical protein